MFENHLEGDESTEIDKVAETIQDLVDGVDRYTRVRFPADGLHHGEDTIWAHYMILKPTEFDNKTPKLVYPTKPLADGR